MRTWEYAVTLRCAVVPTQRVAPKPAISPTLLNLVSGYELNTLKEELARGTLPADFQAKLLNLAKGSLLHSAIEQNCRLFFTLLLADHEGLFRHLSPTQRERLLRVLAYVRKDDDYIPDYQVDGFSDDQQEVNAARLELAHVLNNFKAWRLRHQVPGLWSFSQQAGRVNS
jgi:hypothetical protein